MKTITKRSNKQKRNLSGGATFVKMPQVAPVAPVAPVPSVVLTDTLRARIEARYLELAQPVEFDGIRTQIAAELGISKIVVRRVVWALRARMLPTWFDLRLYTAGTANLERIRERYVPLLPVPPLRVHEQLAAELGLDAQQVYHGIRRIRAEMRLPQYKPPR